MIWSFFSHFLSILLDLNISCNLIRTLHFVEILSVAFYFDRIETVLSMNEVRKWNCGDYERMKKKNIHKKLVFVVCFAYFCLSHWRRIEILKIEPKRKSEKWRPKIHCLPRILLYARFVQQFTFMTNTHIHTFTSY